MRRLGLLLALLLPASLLPLRSNAAPPVMQAGFAVRSIVPEVSAWSQVWHTTRRRPTGVLPGDGLWATAAFVERDGVRLGVVSLDLLGLFHDDVVIIRDRVRAALGGDVEMLVASTHTHSSIDTLGVYGPNETTSGLNADYQELVRSRAVEATLAAAAAAQDVTEVRIGSLPAPAGINEYDRNRHPGSFDDGVNVVQLAGPGGAIGTIVNWASHPELIDAKSSSDPKIPPSMRGAILSSDYVHTLRRTVEQGGGGTTLYLNGPNGAVTGLAMTIPDPDGGFFPKKSVKKAYHVGTQIGLTALEALSASNARTLPDAPLSARSEAFYLTIHNPFLIALNKAGVIPRKTYTAGVENPAGREVKTEMMRIVLGPVEMLTMPGEMQPDLYTGGYQPLDERANPDVPPERPVRPQMTGEVRFVVGLGMDELGYFVSATDYVWPSVMPLYSNGVDRNDIDHYQETLSIGRDAARALSQQASRMLGVEPEPDYLAYPGGFLSEDGAWYGAPTGTDVRGIWVDTSDSGRYERREDAELRTPLPAGVPAAYGYLDSQMRDLGATPSDRARGVWIDGDGDGVFDVLADPHLFFDTYLLGEGPLEP